ncbi:hypothetical protein Avbf_08720 [Armadillidium vulgare]|nr:hypothetical protein Avbf_08720 [Armadillidium vulgare]
MEERKRVRYKICYILKICQCIPFGFAALFQLEAIEEELNGGGVMRVDACEKLCSCCGHVPVLHRELTVLKKPSNIIDYPRQENNSLEKILNVNY